MKDPDPDEDYSMIIRKTMSSDYLSNTYLLADEEGGHGVIIDTGGPSEPIFEAIEEGRIEVTHILCTHHHVDHVRGNERFQERYGCPICAHRQEVGLFDNVGQVVDRPLDQGDELVSGGLHIRALHTPGHTEGMLALVVNDELVFTGDTLFRHSVGGTVGPGHTTFEDLKHSTMDVLMGLPRDMKVYPGHTDPTTIGEEWENNPFIRLWRGLESGREARCTAMGRPATLILRAEDYDGGTKCWVRFDDGTDAIVPGSRTFEDD